VQNYAWGKPWETSLVAQLSEAADRPQDRSQLFAEMWMGTHPSGPAFVQFASGLVSIKELIENSPEHWLGSDAKRMDLPYLLKVLSINQALSIQAHPDRTLAEQLHKSNPSNYKDQNHKPEIALPLGNFEALCAFRTTEEICSFVKDIDELRALCGLDGGIKEMYSRLMRSDPDVVADMVHTLVRRIETKPASDLSAEESLIIRLEKDYPGDVGIFSVFFLNYVRIRADEKNRFIFCAPDEPHAYLLGDCIECMARSDNVVRCGLTRKFKDTEVLLDMMTYRDDLLSSLVNIGKRVNPGVIKYDAPVEDFLLYEIEGHCDEQILELPHAAMALCVSGSFVVDFQVEASQVEVVRRGQVFLIRAGTTLKLQQSGSEAGRLFIASY